MTLLKVLGVTLVTWLVLGAIIATWVYLAGGTFGQRCTAAGYTPDTEPFVQCLHRLSLGAPAILKEQ